MQIIQNSYAYRISQVIQNYSLINACNTDFLSLIHDDYYIYCTYTSTAIYSGVCAVEFALSKVLASYKFNVSHRNKKLRGRI
jgi:hypothetical protein